MISIPQLLFVFIMVSGGIPLSLFETPIQAVWPSIAALSIVLVTRKAVIGLFAGAISGALILAEGSWWDACLSLFSEHLVPHFESSWKMGAVALTLVLGGFAAVLEKGGGFEKIFDWSLKKIKDPAKGLQAGVMSLGLVCFFDGLANSMLVGRISRKLGKRCGVSGEKLAYLVDSTSSAVACLAFVSTWIAYQLSMIKDGFSIVGQEVNPYLHFIRSVPFNFYCWFTLVLCAVCIFRNFNPGAMKSVECSARQNLDKNTSLFGNTISRSGSVLSVVVPLSVLLVGMIFAFYVIGLCEPLEGGAISSYFPITGEKVSAAFGSGKGPYIMVFMGVVGSLVAMALYPHGTAKIGAVSVYIEGMRSMLVPLLILLGAWMLSSTLTALKAGEFIASFIGDAVPLWSIPLIVFVAGALISFTMGSSWATMGILMPLAIPMVAGHSDPIDLGAVETVYAAVIGAVFSGAVFGDHCSPISDTTIVSSIACGVEPHNHVRTQMPYALMAALAAAILGFLPVGFRVSPWLSLSLGTGVLIGIGWWRGSRGAVN